MKFIDDSLTVIQLVLVHCAKSNGSMLHNLGNNFYRRPLNFYYFLINYQNLFKIKMYTCKVHINLERSHV
jgi:hypothetical protein